MIHPSAIVDPGAKLGANVSVGPFSVIGPDVEIGDDCQIGAHVIIKGPTRMGRGNKIFQFASVGEDTPAFAYKGEPTWLEMGDNNVIREGVTIHRGTVQDQSKTVIGSNNLLMAYVHVGHDCVLGDHIIMVNNSSVSGHCYVGDWAIISGYAGLPQYRSVGPHAFVGGMSLVLKDVPAFVNVDGNPAGAIGMNVEGMKRRGFTTDDIEAVRAAYRVIYRRGLLLKEALAELAPMAAQVPAVAMLVASIEASRNGIIRERRKAKD